MQKFKKKSKKLKDNKTLDTSSMGIKLAFKDIMEKSERMNKATIFPIVFKSLNDSMLI